MKKFDLMLSEAASIAMNKVFGNAASECIFEAAERHLSLVRHEVGQNFWVFHAYLERLLGQEQARIIQSTTLRFLCLRLKQEYEEIDAYFLLLDRLYETKFKLVGYLCEEKRPACN